MVHFRSYIPVFLTQLGRNIPNALNKTGEVGISKLNKHVPVDTGFMKSRNAYITGSNYVDIGNYNCSYNAFVELGTYKQHAKPFVKPSAFNYVNEYERVLVNELKRGMR